MGSPAAYRVILLAIVFLMVESNQEKGKPHKCQHPERHVRFLARRDTFCHPKLTMPRFLDKKRKCVCKKGYIRNAWDKCITKEECKSCDPELKLDFNPCGSACNITCNRPIPLRCRNKPCVVGCTCPPGYVREPGRNKRGCVAANVCPPRCPKHSTFHPCPSTCQPRCQHRHPVDCVHKCRTGDCVCEPGYAKLQRYFKEVCVAKDQCPHRNDIPAGPYQEKNKTLPGPFQEKNRTPSYPFQEKNKPTNNDFPL
ncbi:uncharacterized protein LOC144142466 [Haemaphysalis longicornis]